MAPETISNLLISRAQSDPDAPAFTFPGRSNVAAASLSSAQLAVKAARAAAAFKRSGLKKGAAVGLVVIDPGEFICAFLGALHGGFIPVPLAPPVSLAQLGSYTKRLRAILSSCGARHAVASARIRPLLGTLAGDPIDCFHSPDALTNEADEAPLDAVSHNEPAFLQYTSGSTAAPKGVQVSHANILANTACIARALELDSQRDQFCSWLPLSHDMGLIGFVLTPLHHGVHGTILSPLQFLRDPFNWLAAMSSLRATISFAPNFAYALCTRRIGDERLSELDLSAWRVAGCGAEPVHWNTLQHFAEHFRTAGFSRAAFLPAYGMAECTLACTFAALREPPSCDRIDLGQLAERGRARPPVTPDGPAAAIVSCGKPFPGHEVRIVDENSAPLPERSVGEIQVRGPSVTAGYFCNADATDAAFDEDWLKTGDLGYLAGGELYICGRLKEVIIISGSNYYPSDIEEAAGVQGTRKGRVAAFSVQQVGEADRLVICAETKLPAERHAALAKDVRTAVRQAIGIPPAEVVLLPAGALPKTTSGKLQRTLVRDRYLSGALLETAAGRPPAAAAAAHVLVSQWGFVKQWLRRPRS